ncbi:hypothetical protein PVK06_032211 [Gossypium arboreum]|uniref:Uncharacterized protein n=1 Tax=Gossypium arboreum TaxID=29729 RepID=A0ABR0NT95_GOSAR|nr:hypothetical protein PVK06_032211 [Gossypium arboreum]
MARALLFSGLQLNAAKNELFSAGISEKGIGNYQKSYWFSACYAGILQLIEVVIYNIQAYWCRQVLLPKGVLKKISHICSSFVISEEQLGVEIRNCSLFGISHANGDGLLAKVKESVQA